MKLLALIIGAGRMGAGAGGFDTYPYAYNHAAMYRACGVELAGFVEPDIERQLLARARWGVSGWQDLEAALKDTEPSLVSVCTPEAIRESVLTTLAMFRSVRGVLCEKPYGTTKTDWPFVVQVHYPRRFCPVHRAVRVATHQMPGSKTLVVWARKDLTTAVHFTNLAHWFGADLVYQDNRGEIPGTNSYRLECGKWAVEFRNGGVAGGFMQTALADLIAAVTSGTEPVSSITSAIRSEAWAARLIETV